MNSSYSNIIKSQVEWLSTLIMDNGEFVMHNVPSDSSYRIVPYFSNIAALALLKDFDKIKLVKKYMLWYISHLNFPDKFGAQGTIYDYTLKTDGQLISKDDYDSNDSYPATFLSLCKNYFIVSKDYDFFITNRKLVDAIAVSMISCMDNDYLTWAKPNYKVKYLMDNCEVYKGLKDASLIYRDVYNDYEEYSRLWRLSKHLQDSIENKMWNKAGFYYYQIVESGKTYSPDYKKWYPDATSQLFPILCRVTNPTSGRAKYIYSKFNESYPNWYSYRSEKSFPDAFIGYVALLMDDFDKAENFLEFCNKKYVEPGNIWPWYNVESSYYIRTMKMLKVK